MNVLQINEELSDLYSLPNIVRVVKSRTGVGELFYLLPQNIFIYADVTPLI
jgi:hypothetical protein